MTRNDVLDYLQTAIQIVEECREYTYDTLKPFDDEVISTIQTLRESITDLELRNKLRQKGF